MMTLDLLWTDVCYLGVLSALTIMVLLGLKKKRNRDAFKTIWHKPAGVCACIVLSFFLAISVLDSIHFHSERSGVNGSLSVLDNILYPIGSFYEKTYSAPLAYVSFSKEIQARDDTYRQAYPKLIYPQQQAGTEAMYYKTLNEVFWRSSLATLLVILCGCTLLFFMRCSPSAISAFFTFTMMLGLMGLLYGLSRYGHVLGTGQIGEDIFYYTVKSIRTGMVIGLLTTLFMMPLALFLGISAGYFGGIIDDVIQFTYTTLSSIPGVLLITASVLSLQTYIANHPERFSSVAESADARLLALCMILGVTSWTSLCRLLRAEALKLRDIDFVMAARALGSGWFTIIQKHLLPNVMHIVIMTIVLDFSFLVLAEAVLSYVGVGVSPTTMSWGNMINGARMELARDPIIWWPIIAAFTFMFLLVLAVNMAAEALRDAFDPHHYG